VKGTLKRLPKHREIWLLHQDEKTGLIFPQGFRLLNTIIEMGHGQERTCHPFSFARLQ